MSRVKQYSDELVLEKLEEFLMEMDSCVPHLKNTIAGPCVIRVVLAEIRLKDPVIDGYLWQMPFVQYPHLRLRLVREPGWQCEILRTRRHDLGHLVTNRRPDVRRKSLR